MTIGKPPVGDLSAVLVLTRMAQTAASVTPQLTQPGFQGTWVKLETGH